MALGSSAAQIRSPKDAKLEMLSRRAVLSGNTLLLLPPFLVYLWSAVYRKHDEMPVCDSSCDDDDDDVNVLREYYLVFVGVC